ncbi:MAG: polysaccharide deacetylase family protein [Bacteroidaceae bacterium]|nr:polysaccharide deacetylase family protein [Bacteroidaceae bacterium]
MKKYILMAWMLGLLAGYKEPAKHIALTFDDGPNTTTTMKMLDVMEKHGAVGSFFVIGDNINEESTKTMKRAIRMGCDIQNHSRTHPYMSKLTPEQIIEEVNVTQDRIEEHTGTRPTYFRAPYIDVNDTMYQLIDMIFICGEGCDDWDAKVSLEERIERTIRQAEDGQIVLLHDFHGNDATAQALEVIIPTLKEQGYEFVTVGELFRKKGITPEKGKLYSNVLKD